MYPVRTLDGASATTTRADWRKTIKWLITNYSAKMSPLHLANLVDRINNQIDSISSSDTIWVRVQGAEEVKALRECWKNFIDGEYRQTISEIGVNIPRDDP